MVRPEGDSTAQSHLCRAPCGRGGHCPTPLLARGDPLRRGLRSPVHGAETLRLTPGRAATACGHCGAQRAPHVEGAHQPQDGATSLLFPGIPVLGPEHPRPGLVLAPAGLPGRRGGAARGVWGGEDTSALLKMERPDAPRADPARAPCLKDQGWEPDPQD